MEFYGESPRDTIPTKVAPSDKNFTSRVDQIVVASIERYMWGKGFDKRDAYWEKTRSGGVGEKDDYVRVTFPDGSGKGGGLVTYQGNFFLYEMHYDYQADFDTIRNNVTYECKPLNNYPSEGAMNGVVTTLLQIRDDLSVSDGRTDIGNALLVIQGADELIKGGNYYQFMKSVANALPGVVQSLSDLVACMHSAVESNKRAVCNFTFDIGPAMDSLIEELKDHGESISLNDLLAVARWTLTELGASASAGPVGWAKIAVDSVIGAVKTIEYAADRQAAVASGIGWGIDAGPKAVRSLLTSRSEASSLSGALFDAEEQIAIFLNSTSKVVNDRRDSYDFHPSVIKGRASGLDIEDLESLRSLADEAFPEVSSGLRAAANRMAGLGYSSAFSRDWAIGRGTNGISVELNALGDFVISSLNAVADEVENVGYSLHDYVNDIEQTEQDSAAALARAANDQSPQAVHVVSNSLYSSRHQRELG